MQTDDKGLTVVLVEASRQDLVEFAAEDALIYGMNTDTHTLPHLTPDHGDGSAVLLTVRQAAHRLAIGRSTLYLLIAEGELEVIHIGRAVRIPADAIDAFIGRRRANGSDHGGGEPTAPSANCKQQTANSKQQTANSKQQTATESSSALMSSHPRMERSNHRAAV